MSSRRGDRDGGETDVFNHETHHRGQIVTLLRQAGYSGPLSTDLAFMSV